MITLENEFLKASLHTHGAELHSLVHKEFDLEYLWNGDKTFWPRHSPVLFPIVGGLIDNTFNYKGESYSLIKHGFARDMEFETETSSPDFASFILKSNAETLVSYPFEFLLRISYRLKGTSITVGYEVENPGSETMYFSIGAHPAFNVPLVEGSGYEDYYLEFEKPENSVRHIVSGNAIVKTEPYFNNESTLPLKADLFYSDALIFKDLKSTRISLKSSKTDHGFDYNFDGFPYMGIWAAKDAPFVCIEPWCGITDSEGHNQNIEEKEGMIVLSEGNSWSKEYSWNCF